MRHRDRPAVGGRQERGVDDDVADAPPRQSEPPGQKRQVHIRGAGHVGREEGLPDAPPVLLLWEGELDDELQAAGERLV